MFRKLFGGSKKNTDKKIEDQVEQEAVQDDAQHVGAATEDALVEETQIQETPDIDVADEQVETASEDTNIEIDASIAAFKDTNEDDTFDDADEIIEPLDDNSESASEEAESASELDQQETDKNVEKSQEISTISNEPKRSWFQRLTQGLSKSNNNLVSGIGNIFTKAKLDDDTIEALEDILIQADLGTDTAVKISEDLADQAYDKEISPEEIRNYLNQEITKILDPVAKPLIIGDQKPYIILMTGVNGAGKTTSIGKLAAKFKADGKKVMLAAGDTFRAAAVQQLVAWGERADVPVVSGKEGIDAASLAFEAIDQARKQDIDVLMIDTAGRLQNRTELMEELEKVVRVIKKQDATAPHASLLVLDATTGQNAVNQTQIFGERINISGLIMTKLDGSAKGGILVAIAARFKLPVHFIGVGESIEDMEPFAADQFADALTSSTQEGSST